MGSLVRIKIINKTINTNFYESSFNSFNELFAFYDIVRIADPSQRENLGIIVQYKVKVKLCITPLCGYVNLLLTLPTSKIFFNFETYRDLVAELPFILMHPKPDDIDDNILVTENNSPNNNNIHGNSRNNQGDKQTSGTNSSSAAAKDDAPNLIQLDG